MGRGSQFRQVERWVGGLSGWGRGSGTPVPSTEKFWSPFSSNIQGLILLTLVHQISYSVEKERWRVKKKEKKQTSEKSEEEMEIKKDRLCRNTVLQE